MSYATMFLSFLAGMHFMMAVDDRMVSKRPWFMNAFTAVIYVGTAIFLTIYP